MSSRRGGRGPSGTGRAGLPKEKNISGGSIPKVEQLSGAVGNVSLGSAQGGKWEVLSRKPMNRGGSSSSNPWGSQNSNQKAWGQPDTEQKLGLGANRGPGNSSSTLNADPRRPADVGNCYVAPQPEIAPALQGGWNWKGRPAASQFENGSGGNRVHFDTNPVNDDADNEDDSDAVDSDDELLSDDFDSDESVKSHGTRKQSKWFTSFFKSLDGLTLEQINEPLRQWHCPACAGGPGAIDWYEGLQPLMAHAKTKGSKRVRLHRELAELLDEELRRRGTSVVPAGEAFGKWKGLTQEVKDREIVWPPMVCIMNTQLDQDDNDKWIGMGNQELLDYFSAYNPAKARHSYGPQGHRGMSVLIFENTAVGYLDAERLHNHFHDQGSDREAWNRRPKLFYAGGKRQLFGYMAEKHDLTIFNQHSQGKSKLKFDMRSYLEMVVNQLKQMSEDNQALIYYKNRVVKEQRHSKALEESFGLVSEKLRKTLEENRIVRQRSKMHHEQNKEEMDFQEQFFKDQLEVIHKARDAKEDTFEKIQQQEREKVKKSSATVSATQGETPRSEDVAKFIKIQEKEMKEFVEERDGLIKAHENRKMEMKKRHWEEEVKLEKEFDDELSQLMAKYTPPPSTSSTSNGSNSNDHQ